MMRLSPVLRDVKTSFAPALRGPCGISALLLVAALLMAPFFTGTDTFWFAPSLVCIYAMAGLWLATGLRDGWALPHAVTAALVLAFALYTAQSVIWSRAPYISMIFVYVVTSLPLLFFVLTIATAKVQVTRIHVASLFSVLCVWALWALVQFFFLYEEYGPRIRHPMLSPNSLAALFMVGFFLALALWMRVGQARGVAWRGWLAFVPVLVMMIALLTTQSRGGMIFTAFSLLVFVIVLRGRGGMDGRRLAVLGAGGVFSWLVVNIVSKGYLTGNLGQLAVATQLNSLNDRLALYKSSWAMMRDYPWQGIGLGTFYFTYPAYRAPTDYSDGYFTHMDPLQYGLEMGVIAFVLFYAILVAVLLRTIAAVRATPKEDFRRVEIMAAFCALLAIVMHTHIDFHLYILVTLMAVAVPLAWWYAVSAEVLDERPLMVAPPAGPLWAWRTIILLGLILALNWPVRAGVTAWQIAAVQKEMAAGQLEAAEERLRALARYAPASTYRMHQFFGRLAQARLARDHAHMTREEARALFLAAEESYTRALLYNKDFSGIRADRAKLYFTVQDWLISDGYERAQYDLEQAHKHNPLDWDVRIGLVRTYEAQGYFKKALAVLQEGRRWPVPLGPMGVTLLVMERDIHLKLGNRAAYEDMQKRAQELARQSGLTVQAP